MLIRCLFQVLFCICLLNSFTLNQVSGAEINEFLEAFSLGDRQEALKKLIPGTNDYYFYHALDAQHRGDPARFEVLLKDWDKQIPHAAEREALALRQAVLDYERKPQESIAYLCNTLGIQFYHQPPNSDNQAHIPNTLNQSLINFQAFVNEAKRYEASGLSGFEDWYLSYVTTDDKLAINELRDYLRRLPFPRAPKLVDLIIKELSDRHSGGFGSLPIHDKLFLEQLQELQQKRPALSGDDRFIRAMLSRLQPRDGSTWRVDPIAYVAYLDRLWTYVSSLPAAHNSLKANVLYHRLAHDQTQNAFNQALFTQYLSLPRTGMYVSKNFQRLNPRDQIALAQSYKDQIGLPPIGTEESLIKAYLEHFFNAGVAVDTFNQYLEKNYTDAIYAETMVLMAKGDQEQWASWLGAERYRDIQQRIELAFSAQNKTRFLMNTPVQLQLELKNIDILLVRVYPIHTEAWFQDGKTDSFSNFDVDGLVTEFEQRIAYTEHPAKRHKETIDLAAINKRGVYIVECLGNGYRCRSVVRIGDLHVRERLGTAGHVLRVYDESFNVVKNAVAYFGNHRLEADEEGGILVPFATTAGTKNIVIVHDGFAVPYALNHRLEEYQLQIQAQLDRQDALAGQLATVLIRSQLFLHGEPVSLADVTDLQVVIDAETLDGIHTKELIEDVKMNEVDAWKHDIRFPDRVRSVSIAVSGKIEQVSTGQKQDVSASTQLDFNGMLAQTQINDLFLRKQQGAYVIDILGRNGEAYADKDVLTITYKHRYFTRTISTQLRADKLGAVHLGALADIENIKVDWAGVPRFWQLPKTALLTAHEFHMSSTDSLSLAWTGTAADKPYIHLMSLRNQRWYADHSAQVQLDASGRLQIQNLAAGDYELYLPNQKAATHLIVEDAERKSAQLFGAARILSDTVPHALQIGTPSLENDFIRVPVFGASAATRIHLLATRFIDDTHFLHKFGRVSFRNQDVFYPQLVQSEYLVMRRLSDEHRYVLDRPYQEMFPSLSLQRPALLLHPWERSATDTDHLFSAVGEGGGADGAFGSRNGGGKRRSASGYGGSAALTGSSNYDFLQHGAVVLYNLGVDEKGVLSVPRELLHDQVQLQILAVEPEQAFLRCFDLPEQNLLRRERRFMPVLDEQITYRQDKRVAVLQAGKTLAVNQDPNTWRILDSLPQAFDLLDTLCEDKRLADFQFIKRWPQLSTEERLREYSDHACHELNAFLFFKDKAFFDQIIKPTLIYKHDKTFLDHFFLDDDLTAYTRPWAFERLNTFERILLMRRMATQHDPILRSLQESMALQIPDQAAQDLWFTTALRGKSLDKSQAFIAIGAGGEAQGQLAGLRKTERQKRQYNEESEVLLMADEAAEEKAAAPMAAAPAVADKDGYFANDRKAKKQAQRLYRQVDQTKEWAENNYYHRRPQEQLANLVEPNRYWLDYAKHQAGAFQSQHMVEAHRNAAEVMLCLAVLDLPFVATEQKIAAAGQVQEVTASSPLLLYYIDIVESPFAKEDAAVVVTQQLYRLNDRYRYENNQNIERFVKGDFLYRDVYGVQIVITNPGAEPRHIQLLKQIPQGGIPLAGNHASQSHAMHINAYSVQRFDVLFYFPEAGSFALQPATVSSGGAIIGRADARTLNVTTALPDVDKGSWQYIADFGTNQQVLDYLKRENVLRLDLERIAFRVQDPKMFNQVIAVLEAAKVYEPVLWSYGFKHNDLKTMRSWLEHNEVVTRSCGSYIYAKLLSLDSVERMNYEHVEFYPLINARTHALAGKQQIANASLATQYDAYLNNLRYLPALRQGDHFASVIYLLAQDRVAEALKHFAVLDKSKLDQDMQYDYCKAYLALMQSDLNTAREICTAYADCGILRWRLQFAAMLGQLQEFEQAQNKSPEDRNREQDMDQRAQSEAMLSIDSKGFQVSIEHRNLKNCEVKIYRMNLELLFSRNPFMRGDDGQFAYVSPNHSELLSLDEKVQQTTYDLPVEFRKGNVLVEVNAAGLRRRSVLFVHQLHVLTQDNYGQVHVQLSDSAKPVSKAYVKVYAKMKSGEVNFYKDGYTDFRGRFDYAALSTNDLDNVERFALYIEHPEYGALVREVNPPQR